MQRFIRLSALVGMIATVLLTGCSGGSSGSSTAAASADPQYAVANPVVDGPVSGGLGTFVSATMFPLFLVGYQQEEYFLTGSAASYTPATPLTSDGHWNVQVADHADYKTRIVVNRPIDPAKFNGTVIVEWLNVSGGLDSAPDWIMAHNELIRSGYAWVGVSAQKEGIEGGGTIGIVDLPLKKFDATRYGSLHHPGNGYSYDIFSQAAQAVRHPQGIDPLGGLTIKKMIAAGESQSAWRMTSYVNAIAPIGRLFDGFFIHSRPGRMPPDTPQADFDPPATVLIRDDIAPVMTLQTESDLFLLDYYPHRQDDSANFRLWEVAGTAHADAYTLFGLVDVGIDTKYAQVAAISKPMPGIIECAKPINAGPQHFVVSAAFAALNRWITTGVPPANAPRFTVSGDPAAYALDAHGNVLGGIRTPFVDAPVATLSAYGQPGSMYDIGHGGESFCFLFGTTTLFDDATLRALYPNHASYVAAVTASADSAVAQGFLLAVDAELIKKAAQASTIGN